MLAPCARWEARDYLLNLLEIQCHYVAQAGPWIHHSCLRLPGAGDWSQECTMTPGSVIFFWGKEVSHVVQASLTSTLELEMILPPHPEYWGDKCASPHLVYTALWSNGGSLHLRLFKLALLPACNIFIHVSLTVSSDNNDQCIQKKHKKFQENSLLSFLGSSQSLMEW